MAIVSPGSLLRAEKSAGTELGRQAAEITGRGHLVGDTIINSLVGKWLADQSGAGFVFDGYPRTVGQAEALGVMLNQRETPLEMVVLLEASEDELLRRVESRATCAECGLIVRIGLHVQSLTDKCPRCGGVLMRRADDTAETLNNRLVEYREKTEPLVDYYERQGLLSRVRTEAAPDTVFQEVTKLIA
jgi:adenylate kinase